MRKTLAASRSSHGSTLFLLALALCCAFGACSKHEAAPPVQRASKDVAPAPRAQKRLVILGFDGVDPRRVEALTAAGRMPNVASLSQQGWRGALGTTNPPQSPVAWAAFATGFRAGDHGIFDFVRRDAATYMPQVATTRVRHAEVDGDQVTPAAAFNLRHGEAFWDVIARSGVATRTLTVPYAFPPAGSGAISLAGLGVPDVRGTNSSFTYLTADGARAGGDTPAGGQMTLLAPTGEGVWKADIDGPTLQVDGGRQTPSVAVTVQALPNALRLQLGDKSYDVALGETSPYLTLDFRAGLALHIAAATRLTVRALAPRPEVYVEPLSILPSAPYLPLSTPASFAAQMWDRLGPFKTVGWVDDTSGLGADVIDEATFLREAAGTMGWTEKAVTAALQDDTERMIVAVFTTPDRIQHMFYRYLDHDTTSAPRYAEAIDQVYVDVDRIIGHVRGTLRADDTLLVMSDHGFGAFRRGFNINRWLIDHGYLVLQRGVREPRELFADVDWKRSRAYAFGTGGIYLNVQGRERGGTVAPANAGALARRIAHEIETVRDGGKRVVLATYLGDNLYAGPGRAEAPDIRVALSDGYRASWSTGLGGAPRELFEDNTKKWSGDHASARPEDVPGLLLTNRPVVIGAPRIEDISRTAYAWAEVEPPAGNIGRALFKQETEHATR